MPDSSDIRDDELVGRALSETARRFISRLRWRRTHTAKPADFLDKKNPTRLSVDRLSKASESLGVYIAEERAAANHKVFQGWVSVEVHEILMVFQGHGGVASVASASIDENPYHAEIHFPYGWEEDVKERSKRCQALLDCAEWKERPGLELLG